MENKLMTDEEWKMLSAESRHRLNVFYKDYEDICFKLIEAEALLSEYISRYGEL